MYLHPERIAMALWELLTWSKVLATSQSLKSFAFQLFRHVQHMDLLSLITIKPVPGALAVLSIHRKSYITCTLFSTPIPVNQSTLSTFFNRVHTDLGSKSLK